MSSWRPVRRRWWLDLTPLIDVVFTLFLFVILAAQFQEEDSLPLNLPQDAAPRPGPAEALVVTAGADGTVLLAGKVWTGADLGRSVAAELAGGGKTSVVLRADGSVAYSRVFELLASLGSAGVRDVGLAYEPKPKEPVGLEVSRPTGADFGAKNGDE